MGLPANLHEAKKIRVNRFIVVYLMLLNGGLAQLGERLAGSQKVRGSSPLSSTFFLFFLRLQLTGVNRFSQ